MIKKINEKKNLGQVFTPLNIVKLILNEVGYTENILNKKILEPSFGNGAFLLEIVERLINYCRYIGLSNKDIKNQLENNIYGIEIDKALYEETLDKLNKLVLSYNIEEAIQWNLLNENTLYQNKFKDFDFIVGNPPYIRVHNLDTTTREYIKKFSFSVGITDLYVLFFELSINLLNDSGLLGFITPNSFMKNNSQKSFRKYLIENNLIEKIIDFNSFKVFKNADTYSAISIINKKKKDSILTYTEYQNKVKRLIDIDLSNYIYKNDLTHQWNFRLINNINKISEKGKQIQDFYNVQYGIVTNKDSVFIGNIEDIESDIFVLFNGFKIEKSILRPVIKGSTFTGEKPNKMIIFPYKWNSIKNRYEPIKEEELMSTYPFAYKYLLHFKEQLLNRNINKNTKWYEFGRSQGINNSRYEKIVFKHIISDKETTLKIHIIPKETIVYSGIFITCKEDIPLLEIKEVLSSEEFCGYCKAIGKDMKGNYKVVNSKYIKQYNF